MFGVGAPELVLAGVLVVVGIVLVRVLGTAQWGRVDRVEPVAVTTHALEIPVARLLADLPGTRLQAGGRSTWTLSVERAPWWTLVPAVLLFPFGLLFLLFRQHATLLVTLRAVPGGTEVHLLGTTRLAVRTALDRAIAGLPAAERPRPDVGAAP